MRSRLIHKIVEICVVPFAARVLNLWFSTCRIKIMGEEIYREFTLNDAKAVGATWHRGAIFLVWFFRNLHPMIMFSRSRDGELLARFAGLLGVVPVRGSSSRGGRKALEEMRHFLMLPGSKKAATVLDGPRGPAYVAKKGMLVLASQARVPLIPIMVSAFPALTFSRSWDKTMVPLPFSRVTVMFKEPWHIASHENPQKLEQLRIELERTLNRMRVLADLDTGYTGG